MKLFYVPITVGLLTLAADAADQGGGQGRWVGRHGGHHGGGHWKAGGGGHCRRGDAMGCDVIVTAKFDEGSVTPDVLKLDSDFFRPITHVQENVEFPVEIRRRIPITPDTTITYTMLKYAAGGQKTGTFQEANCGKIAPDFKGGRIHMTFSKKPDGWYNCVLSYPK